MRPWARAGLVVSLFLLAGTLVLGGPTAWAASDQGQSGQAVESSQAEHGQEGHGGSSQKLWDLLWRTMNFAAVAAVLIILLRKPLSSGLRSRKETIKNELDSLEASKEEAQRELEETLAKLEELKTEKEKIVQEFMALGETEKAKILAEAEQMAGRIREQTSLRIEQEVETARARLQEEIAELSVAKAVELVQEKITPADQERLVDDYLKKVVG